MTPTFVEENRFGRVVSERATVEEGSISEYVVELKVVFVLEG
ncbi:MAG: hypothetical protein V3T14_11940 [Myxococcota bacterium]